MPQNDLRLIFETEKRILERRLKELFPSKGPGSVPPEPPTPPHEPKHPRRHGGRPLGGFLMRFLHATTSLAFHLVILAILYPYFSASVPEETAKKIRPDVNWIDISELYGNTDEPENDPKADEKAPDKDEPEAPEVAPAEIVQSDPTPEPPKGEPEEAPADEPSTDKDTDRLLGLSGADSASGGEPDGAHGGLTSRYGSKATALQQYGGADETEIAVAKGLEWLARHQDKNGSWDPQGFSRHCRRGRRCGGPGFGEYRAGITALATLAFLGAGVDGTSDHPYRENVRQALEFLLAIQDDTGCFGREGKKYMYNHTIATFCVAEAYQVTQDPRFKGAAARGLEFAKRSQQSGGGWDYTTAKTGRNDLSVTGWMVMAIHTARAAGIPLDTGMHKKVRRYISRAVAPSGAAVYANRGIGKGREGISIAAVGMLCKLYLDWSPRSSELESSSRRLVRRPPDAEGRVHWEREYQSSYYWYYATLSLFHMGGDEWEAWNTLLKREVLPLQRKRGEREGSWEPDPNWLGAEGGRIATTALNVLTFEVYYRYKPMHKKYGLNQNREE